jgi:hypothetical protein
MSWEELILTVLFTFSINLTIEHLETKPGYSCPVYCEVDHSHFWDDIGTIHFAVVDTDSLFWIALQDSD